MQHRISQHSIYAAGLFLIWPFLSIFFAFRNYHELWAKNIVWLFVAFFGYTMVISNADIDANRYRDQFIEISDGGEQTNLVKGLYAEDTGYVDILKPLLDNLVSLFTNNYKILFLVYGLIFGFFFSRNLWLLLNRITHPATIISIFLLIIFAFINPIWNINGFRFWTAAQLFVYGCLLYFLEGNKKGLLIAFLSPFVHFSFMLPVAVLFIYLLLGNKLLFYFYFFMISMFISELNLESIKNNIEGVLPVVFELKVNNYTNVDYREQRVEAGKGVNWYVPFRTKALKYSVYIFLIVLFWKWRQQIKSNKQLYGLFSFVLFFFGIANIVSSIPSGGRFLNIAFSLSIALTFLFVQKFHDKFINFVLKFSTPALLLYLIVTIRMGFDTIGLTTIIGNPLIALLMEGDKALIELIK